MIYSLLAIIILQMFAIAWVLDMHQRERTDLYNRIMANDFAEYRQGQGHAKRKGGGNIVAAGINKYADAINEFKK